MKISEKNQLIYQMYLDSKIDTHYDEWLQYDISKDYREHILTKLEKEYREYRSFADARGMKMLAEAELVDEYNDFMSRCEEILFSNSETSTFAARIELPKPSSALGAFKNRFNKFL